MSNSVHAEVSRDLSSGNECQRGWGWKARHRGYTSLQEAGFFFAVASAAHRKKKKTAPHGSRRPRAPGKARGDIRMILSRDPRSHDIVPPPATTHSTVKCYAISLTTYMSVYLWRACMHANCMHVSFTRPPALRARQYGSRGSACRP